jgi:hypothetical protein
MANTLATMLTMTTYGTWLRGDHRGWVEDGQIFPADPDLESADRARMKHEAFLIPRDQLFEVGRFIGQSVTSRLQLPIYALTVGTWHVHLVIGPTRLPIGDVIRTAKDSARYGLSIFNRPIWSAGYDKRFCFDERSVLNRITYVERHNERHDWPPRPWPFITAFHP